MTSPLTARIIASQMPNKLFTFFSYAKLCDRSIALATAEMPVLLDAYDSLLSMSDYGEAFPGSHAWLKAHAFAVQLCVLREARPDVDAARCARNAGLDGDTKCSL